MLFRFINNFHQYRPCVWGGGFVGRFLAAYSTKISASVSGDLPLGAAIISSCRS